MERRTENGDHDDEDGGDGVRFCHFYLFLVPAPCCLFGLILVLVLVLVRSIKFDLRRHWRCLRLRRDDCPLSFGDGSSNERCVC